MSIRKMGLKYGHIGIKPNFEHSNQSTTLCTTLWDTKECSPWDLRNGNHVVMILAESDCCHICTQAFQGAILDHGTPCMLLHLYPRYHLSHTMLSTKLPFVPKILLKITETCLVRWVRNLKLEFKIFS